MLTSNFVFADTRQTTYVIAKINNNRTAYTKIININMLQLKGKPFKNSRLFTGAVISDSVYFEQTSINSTQMYKSTQLSQSMKHRGFSF